MTRRRRRNRLEATRPLAGGVLAARHGLGGQLDRLWNGDRRGPALDLERPALRPQRQVVPSGTDMVTLAAAALNVFLLGAQRTSSAADLGG
jgi:hypothetical protein